MKFLNTLKGWLLALVVFCSTAATAHDFEVNGIYYDITDATAKTVAVTYKGNSSDSYSNEYRGTVNIPATVTYNGDTYSVTSIGDFAFYECTSLTSITIPNSVTSIGWAAFTDTAWYDAQPDGIIYAGKVLYDYKGTMPANTSIIVKEGTTGIAGSAFYNCSNLASITIPSSVTSIGERAFYYCSSLASITIPNSVTSIGENAFSGTAWYKAQPDGVVYAGKVLYKYKGTMPANTSIIVKEGTTGIAGGAFYNCSNLASITIPSSVTSIGSYAFEDCSSLASITIPNSVTSIGNYAFYNCSSLASITFPNSVTSIGSGAFYNCSNLASITIPNSVTSIGNGAFYECTSLTSITIPNSVTSIGERAFYGCSSLKSVTMGNGVTNIGRSAFSDCAGLIAVYINDLAAWCNIDYFAEYGSNPLSYAHNLYLNGEKVTDIVIPDDITKIKIMAFSGCTNLTSVTIGNGVTNIGDGAFYGCTGLKTVYNLSTLPLEKGRSNYGYVAYYADKVINAPNGSIEGDFLFGIISGVNTLIEYLGNGGDVALSADYKGGNYVIGKSAFLDCTSLTSISIPNSVTSIGSSAFYGCSSLESLEMGDGVSNIGESAFHGCSSLESLEIGNGVSNIGKSAFLDCTSLTSISIPNSVTSIGSSAFYGCSSLTSLEMGDGVSNIGESAFHGCSSLESLEIGNGVSNIGKSAFLDCTSLTSISIPNSVTSIGNYAFNGCTALKELRIEDGTETLSLGYNYVAPSYDYSWGEGLFYNCPLEKLYLGRNLSYETSWNYGYSPFYNKTALTSVAIGNSVTGIGNYAFRDCSGLSTITIPDNVTNIGEYAFYNCTALKKMRINDGESALEVAPSSFDYCPLEMLHVGRTLSYDTNSASSSPFYAMSTLENVTVGDSVSKIEKYMFAGCKGLKEITFGSAVKLIDDYSLNGCSSLETIYTLGERPAIVGIENFTTTQFLDVKLNVPAGSLRMYQESDTWEKFWEMQEFDVTGVDDIVACEKIDFDRVGSGVILNNTIGKDVAIYATNGSLVNKINDYAGEVVELDKGVYIIRSGGAYVKVFME